MKKPKIDPRQIQVDKLKELGACLRQTRLDKGASLDAIAHHTLISQRLLKAIESGDLDTLPEPVYVQGFLKRYADTLGLNGEKFAEAFPVTEKFRRSKYGFLLRLPLLQLRPIHLYLLYILVIMLAVKGLSQLLQQSAQITGPIEPSSLTVVNAPQAQPTAPTPPATQQVTVSTQARTDKPVVVNIQLKDECWLRVITDGKVAFEGLLPKGIQRTWKADEQVTILAGNAGGVLVTFNDQRAQQLGAPGQVQEVTYQAPQL